MPPEYDTTPLATQTQVFLKLDLARNEGKKGSHFFFKLNSFAQFKRLILLFSFVPPQWAVILFLLAETIDIY